jgi:hypothetical protein
MDSDRGGNNKRARTEAWLANGEHTMVQASDPVHSHSHQHDHINVMSRYPFAITIVTQFLDDCDVLCILLLTAKSMQHLLTGYRVRQPVLYEVYERLMRTTQYLRVCISYVISVSKLPLAASSTVTHIEMHPNFNEPLSDGMFPAQLTCLQFDHDFNQPINPGVLPHTLQHLEFVGTRFKQRLVIGSLPSSLKSLKLRFLQAIPVNVLPSSLTSLQVYQFDDVRLTAALLPNLKSLAFRRFASPSQLVPGALPPGLESVTVGVNSGGWCSGFVPSNVKHLVINSAGVQLDPGVLHSGITSLTLGLYHCPFVIGALPNTLLELHLTRRPYNIHHIAAGVLPRSLKRLTLCDAIFDAGALPTGLEQLSMVLILVDHSSYSHATIEYLEDEPQWHIPVVIPSWVVNTQLTDLSVTIMLCQLLPGVFPSSLRRLDLNIRYALIDECDESKMEYEDWTSTPYELMYAN